MIKHRLAFCAALLILAELIVPAAAADTPIRIAFIDSGISTKHIGPAHVELGKNYVFPDADTQDRIGHGTATASMVLGAADQGVAGVYPDALAVPLVVVDTYPSGTINNGGPPALCEAIYDAVDVFHCEIINISLATPMDSEALQAAVGYAESKGVLIVAVVGNDGEAGRTYYPAAYGSVISVGAADGNGAASFSQGGADILTDGVNLPAATNKNGAAPTFVSGTSYSCAIISGICAKLRSAYPSLSPAELRNGLYQMATDILKPGFDVRSGWGYLPAGTSIPYPYLDVSEDSWYDQGVLAATKQGIMTGTGAGRFTPYGTMTRAMFATVLYRMAGQPPVTGENPFTDVAVGTWYTDAVIWAADENILEGYGRGAFGTNDPVTREQMVTLFWRWSGKPDAQNADLSAFHDTDKISDWAKDAFAWAVSAGVISGKGNGLLDPKGTTTRAEVAQIIMRYETNAG